MGCAEIGGVPHATSATEAVGGDPHGATKCVGGALKWADDVVGDTGCGGGDDADDDDGMGEGGRMMR